MVFFFDSTRTIEVERSSILDRFAEKVDQISKDAESFADVCFPVRSTNSIFFVRIIFSKQTLIGLDEYSISANALIFTSQHDQVDAIFEAVSPLLKKNGYKEVLNTHRYDYPKRFYSHTRF